MSSVEFIQDTAKWVRSIKTLLQISDKMETTLIIEDYNTPESMIAMANCFDGSKLLDWMHLKSPAPKITFIEHTWRYEDLYGKMHSGAQEFLSEDKLYLSKAFNIATCFFVLPDGIDWSKIKPTLIKKKKKLETTLNQATGKLKNEKFLENADQNVIDGVKEIVETLPEELNNINEMLDLI